MNNVLIDFLSSLNVFTEQEVEELADQLTVKDIKKDTILVREGQVCNSCYFVLKGLLRQYSLHDGIDKTIGFYPEYQAVNFFTSINNKVPAASSLSALEDSVVMIGTPEKEQDMYARFPKLEQLTRKMLESDHGKQQDMLSKFITSSPEERYLNILTEQPELIQRVPQYQLASYIGVTPESLSRIRKRINKI